MTVLDKLSGNIRYRENVKKNFELHSRSKRRALVSTFNRFARCTVFSAQTRLEYPSKIQTSKGVRIFGALRVNASVIMLKIHKNIIQVLSIIRIPLLLSSSKKGPCRIIDEKLLLNGGHLRILCTILKSDLSVIVDWLFLERPINRGSWDKIGNNRYKFDQFGNSCKIDDAQSGEVYLA